MVASTTAPGPQCGRDAYTLCSWRSHVREAETRLLDASTAFDSIVSETSANCFDNMHRCVCVCGPMTLFLGGQSFDSIPFSNGREDIAMLLAMSPEARGAANDDEAQLTQQC